MSRGQQWTKALHITWTEIVYFAKVLLVKICQRLKHSCCCCFCVFLVFDFCRFCVIIRVFSSPPQRPVTSDFKGLLYQILSITLFPYLNSWKRAKYFPFQCWVLNKGTTGTIFITSLLWRGLWLRIEPGTSRTRSQHSTTRLSRMRFFKT